jgi:hypothetical protein
LLHRAAHLRHGVDDRCRCLKRGHVKGTARHLADTVREKVDHRQVRRTASIYAVTVRDAGVPTLLPPKKPLAIRAPPSVSDAGRRCASTENDAETRLTASASLDEARTLGRRSSRRFVSSRRQIERSRCPLHSLACPGRNNLTARRVRREGDRERERENERICR